MHTTFSSLAVAFFVPMTLSFLTRRGLRQGDANQAIGGGTGVPTAHVFKIRVCGSARNCYPENQSSRTKTELEGKLSRWAAHKEERRRSYFDVFLFGLRWKRSLSRKNPSHTHTHTHTHTHDWVMCRLKVSQLAPPVSIRRPPWSLNVLAGGVRLRLRAHQDSVRELCLRASRQFACK